MKTKNLKNPRNLRNEEKSEWKTARRNLIKKMALTLPLGLMAKQAHAISCGLTPAQTEGPFYPIADQADTNTDLTIIKGSRKKARGVECRIVGVVQDEFCQPIKGALVEIWQACDTGKYNHPADPNPADLDPDFQYWGKAVTDENGRYSFKTIIPGAYPATATWMRPPHIHYKVSLRGFEELTTQMYWKSHPLNENDRVLGRLSKSEQQRVLVEFKNVNGIQEGRFDLILKAF